MRHPKHWKTHISMEGEPFFCYRPAPDRGTDREAFRYCLAQDRRQRTAKLAVVMPEVMLQVEDEEPRPEPTAPFLSANDHDEALLESLEELAVGKTDAVRLGGGAAVMFTITRKEVARA